MRCASEIQIDVDPVESAKAAGLRYVSDTTPGITRRRVGKRFYFLGVDGLPIRDHETLDRIRALAVPPAWKQVWICQHADGHIQATGRDARGRKQYRYHARWSETRDKTKFGRTIAFGRALPRIRRRVARDLALPGLPREKVLATVVSLLEKTLIRVGNVRYARANKSFGLTTMRDQHVRISGAVLEFHFRGKSGKDHRVKLTDRRLARVVERCRELPGYELFQYVDTDGVRQRVGSADVNAYLRKISGHSVTAKDFRTWAGTVLAALALREFEPVGSTAQARRNVVRAIERVARRLGNTPAICRKCYVHPAVIDAYLDGSLAESIRLGADEALSHSQFELRPEEEAILALLRSRLSRGAGRQRRVA